MKRMMILGLDFWKAVFFLAVLLGLFSVFVCLFFSLFPIFIPILQSLEGLCIHSDGAVDDDLLFKSHLKPDLPTCTCSPFLIFFNWFTLSFLLILFDCGFVRNSGSGVFSVWPFWGEASFLFWFWNYFEATFFTNWQSLISLGLVVLNSLKLFLLNLETKFNPGCSLFYRIQVFWSSTFFCNLILLSAEVVADLNLFRLLSFYESVLYYQISIPIRGLIFLFLLESSWFTEPELMDSLSLVATCLVTVYQFGFTRVSLDNPLWWHQHLSHPVSTCVVWSFVHLSTSVFKLYFFRRTKLFTPHLFLTPNQWTSTYYLGGHLEPLLLVSPRFFNRLQHFHHEIGTASLLQIPGLVTKLVICHNFIYWLITSSLHMESYKANWMVFIYWKNFWRGIWMLANYGYLVFRSYSLFFFYQDVLFYGSSLMCSIRLASFLCTSSCVLCQLVKSEGLTWISINIMKIWQDEEDVWFHYDGVIPFCLKGYITSGHFCKWPVAVNCVCTATPSCSGSVDIRLPSSWFRSNFLMTVLLTPMVTRSITISLDADLMLSSVFCGKHHIMPCNHSCNVS